MLCEFDASADYRAINVIPNRNDRPNPTAGLAVGSGRYDFGFGSDLTSGDEEDAQTDEAAADEERGGEWVASEEVGEGQAEDGGHEGDGGEASGRVATQEDDPEAEADSRRDDALVEQSPDGGLGEVVGVRGFGEEAPDGGQGEGEQGLVEEQGSGGNAREGQLLGDRLDGEDHSRREDYQVARHRCAEVKLLGQDDADSENGGSQTDQPARAQVLAEDEPGEGDCYQRVHINED